MPPRILILGEQMPYLVTQLTARYAVHHLAHETDPHGFLAREGALFAGLVTSAFVGLDPAILAALPRLRIVSNFGVGVDGIDLDATRSRGIVVGYTPDVLNDCVADLAMGMLIDISRGMSTADRFVRAGQWPERRFPLMHSVTRKRLGIVGFGRIGQAIARRAQGFEMAVRYHSRRPVNGTHHVHEPDLLALACWCDVLMVATPGGAATRHLINQAVLDALGPQGFLVNIARGSVVDEPALLDALKSRRIAGAALDVFENEPHVPEGFLALDNVVLLPHVASGTHETRKAMADLTVANLDAFFSGGRVVSPD